MNGLTPYLAVTDASAAIDFYVRAFGGTEVSRWTDTSTGKIGHAELALGDARLFLADEWPEGGVLAPQAGAGSAVSLVLEVNDADAVFDRAVELGAKVDRPVTDQAYGERGGWLFDPFGHRWGISSKVEQLSDGEIQERVGAEYRIT
jgi:PhnB protein